MRALIVHKPSGRDAYRLRRLILYCLRPGPKSQDRERVLGVVDGLDLMIGDSPVAGEVVQEASADLIIGQLGDDIPAGRRLYRHAVLSLASEAEDVRLIPLPIQIKLLADLVRKYAVTCAPGYRFVAIMHGDHQGEDSRGLHAHIIFRNTNAKGKALEWSRADLSNQQGMKWADDLGVTATRGTGVKRERGVKVYPKAKNLDARKIGKYNNEELEQLIKAGRIAAGRRNRSGVLTSVEVGGRRIRLSTARSLVAREHGMVALRSTGAKSSSSTAIHGVVNPVATKAAPPPTRDSARRGHHCRPLGVGLGLGRGSLVGSGGRHPLGSPGTVRAARTGLAKLKSTMAAADYLGRIL